MTDDKRIYRHTKRPEWGMAIFAEEIEDRMRFAFEDGQVRAFKTDQLQVLEYVNLPEGEAEAAVRKIKKSQPRKISAAAAKKKATAKSSS